MGKMTRYGALALVAVMGVAACDRQADPDPAAGTADQDFMHQGMDPEMMAAMVEMQEIQQRLEPVQRQALEDEALASQLETLSQRIDEAMRAEDGDLINRIEAFQSDLAAAQAAGDQETIQSRMGEAQGLQGEIEALQMAILERPAIKAEVEAFEAAHRARMIAIDPDAEELLDRMEEILARFDG